MLVYFYDYRFTDFGRNRQMGYWHIPDSRSDQQPAADSHRVHRIPGNDNNDNDNEARLRATLLRLPVPSDPRPRVVTS